MHSSTIVVVLLSVIVATVSAQCSCQTKPPTDVIYQGETCECGRQYPIQLEMPKITEHRDAHYDYGFTIEKPHQQPAEVKYSFDFHLEKPQPPPGASLGTYGFEVDAPIQKEIDVPRYSFQYQVQTPVEKHDPSNLRELLTEVDRVVLEKQDCNDGSYKGCTCNRYKPTIELVQRCPKHGHLYRQGGRLCPSNQQRYNQESSYIEQQVPVQVSSRRSKRDVPNILPINFREILPGFLPNNRIVKSLSDENQNRISEILKINFGEDPRDNIQELLRPKPLGSTQNIQNEVEIVPNKELLDEKQMKSDFISKIKPKLEEARTNIRNRLTKIVNKARLDTMMGNHLIQKRSTESSESDSSHVYLDDDANFDGSYEPIWKIDNSTPKDKQNLVDEPVNPNDDSRFNNDRYRKHCPQCGDLARKFPCPSCGSNPHERSHPEYFQVKELNSVPYAPGQSRQTMEYDSQPRPFVQRNLEKNRQFKSTSPAQVVDDGIVGSYYNQPNAYGELENILDKNSKAIHSSNRRIGEGHLVQPMDFEHATDAIRLIQELTQRNSNQQNQDYYSNGNSYDVGANSQNYPAKRSFKVIPLIQKEDGSVFVKISPTTSTTEINKQRKKNAPKTNENSRDYSTVYDNKEIKLMSSGIEENILNEDKPKAKNYDILSLTANGSEEVSSGEDMEILKYIFELNEKGHDRESSSTEITDKYITNNAHLNTKRRVQT